MTLTRLFYLTLALVGVLGIPGLAATQTSEMTAAVGRVDGDDDDLACARPRGKAEKIPTSKLIFEYNSTDEDTGVHGAFDSSGWSELCVYDPSGRLILATKPQAQLKALSVGGIFFESREPPEDEISQEEILAAFPEGRYRVAATSFDGKALAGTALLTHDIPAPPTITFPSEGDVVDLNNLVITWEPVTQTIDRESVQITGYEVIVTKEEHEDPHGFSHPILSAHVTPSVTSLTVPAEFLEPGTVYELEVLALEESGNQTITVLFFTTQ